MAKARKDNKGRALRKGESQRTDNTYVYTYTDPFKKRRFVYARDLQTLREKEADLIKNQLDGLDVYVAGSATLNYVFDRYMSTKYDLRRTTRSNYLYMYDHFVREGFGQRKIGEIKYSDVMYFYYYLLNEKDLQANTVDTIHTVLHPTFQLAVRDGIIRMNPSDGVMAEIKRKAGKNKGIRHALTVEQQRAFMNYTANNPVFYHWHPLFTVLLGTGCRVGGKDFYIDLLFYNTKLRCYVAIDLKTGEFKPEQAGKMNFYLSALDDLVKAPEDNPSVGLILCRDENRTIAEYALRDMSKPIGVSEYHLCTDLPLDLKNALPAVEDIRSRIDMKK